MEFTNASWNTDERKWEINKVQDKLYADSPTIANSGETAATDTVYVNGDELLVTPGEWYVSPMYIPRFSTDMMIWVTFQLEGIHRYPAASTDPNLWDVNFLGYEHRHMFHFKVGIQVTHDDRDIEFIQFKRWLMSLYGDRGFANKTLELDNKSCEMISNELAEKIGDKYPGRRLEIDVSEDGENGSKIVYHPNMFA